MRVNAPDLGFATEKRVPGPVQRRVRGRPIHKVRVCHDNRAYVAVPFTIPGAQTVGRQEPEWRADRDYWIAKIFAEVGRHDDATHPNDGTPSGHPITLNMWRVQKDLSSSQKILTADSRIEIAENHHQDVANDEETSPLQVDDFAIHRLAEGDRVYVDVVSVGTTRPGKALVVTITLVPIP